MEHKGERHDLGTDWSRPRALPAEKNTHYCFHCVVALKTQGSHSNVLKYFPMLSIAKNNCFRNSLKSCLGCFPIFKKSLNSSVLHTGTPNLNYNL